ncbi:efflux RND transporter periplasmic adaptor subunit [Ulvibacter antarcticus]|uniref:Cu(I)/Ag(I) efflux system membrane fusion protein n=1 Tax=Ulvibacter antarcticus TaxID=442714 RepID=A0A3L9Z3E2_9FLAO|nr:efflux RND transporter periplasmic adaptor subunit [Ulvibacter antarcticus]RMA66517.1 Cu(I)/Ag(I) efflux system membrane fusion protein [Ulvibacter antarcticus]
MKKSIVIGIVALVLGLFLGYMFFGTSSSEGMEDTHDHSSEEASEQMWTCSMHPQIMQPEAGDCPICGMDLIPAEVDADGLAAEQFKLTENAMALANIQTSVVGGAEALENSLTLSGKIQANEENNAVQSSYFKGRIEKLQVNFTGEKVSRGQLLATIYAPQLVAAQQELITTASIKASQPQLYQAVRNKLKLWKISENQIDQIEASGKVREYFPVYATVSGTVAEKMVNEGDYVEQGQPLLKISNLNNVWAMFDVYENQIAQLKKGDKISVTTNAFPDKTFDSKIDFIDPVLNTSTRTVMVRVVLDNKADLFKPGMFVKGEVVGLTSTSGKATQLSIPATAVLWTGERSLVYVKPLANQSVFEMREITLGNKQGENYQVLSGLSDGEEIVTNGTFTVDAAAQLRGKKSMMNNVKSERSTMQMMDMKLTAKFQNEFVAVVEDYLDLKDAFVTSNPSEVKKEANKVLGSINKVDISSLEKMEKEHIGTIQRMLIAIVENESIENQRDHFIVLSENIIGIAQSMDSLPVEMYVQKCPMANNNKGAVWLSASSEVKNPYYGEAMLSCGSVIDTLKN